MTIERPSSVPRAPRSLRWLNLSLTAALLLVAALTCLHPAALQAGTPGSNSTSSQKESRPAWTELGTASFYYGPRWHGGPTASGERYDQHSMTAAHKTLPMNTLVEVTRLDTGSKVIVRINNRGPYIRGRIIDLSKEAATRLKMVDRGITKVKLRILPGKNTAALEEAMAVRDAEIVHANKDFALTLASFENKADAKRFRERMLAVQVDNATVRRVRLDDGVKYRVEIAGFSSEDDARQQRDVISEKVLSK